MKPCSQCGRVGLFTYQRGNVCPVCRAGKRGPKQRKKSSPKPKVEKGEKEARRRTSAWVPEGLLPPTNHPDYQREYRRLRLIHDPYFRAHRAKVERESRERRLVKLL